MLKVLALERFGGKVEFLLLGGVCSDLKVKVS